jgi:DNA-binding PadR family transcriptional regulator
MTQPTEMTPDTEALLPLHPEAFRILILLRDGPAHGYALVKELERDPGRPGRVLPANLYRRIRTLLEQGLIAESDRRPDPELDDERRRYFRLTEAGETVARAEARRLRDLLAGAADLLKG